MAGWLFFLFNETRRRHVLLFCFLCFSCWILTDGYWSASVAKVFNSIFFSGQFGKKIKGCDQQLIHTMSWCGPRVQAQTKIRHWFHTFDRKMKNSEPNYKLKISFKTRNKRSKMLEENSSMKRRSMDTQIAHQFQDHFHCVRRQVEGHPHYQL